MIIFPPTSGPKWAEWILMPSIRTSVSASRRHSCSYGASTSPPPRPPDQALKLGKPLQNSLIYAKHRKSPRLLHVEMSGPTLGSAFDSPFPAARGPPKGDESPCKSESSRSVLKTDMGEGALIFRNWAQEHFCGEPRHLGSLGIPMS